MQQYHAIKHDETTVTFDTEVISRVKSPFIVGKYCTVIDEGNSNLKKSCCVSEKEGR